MLIKLNGKEKEISSSTIAGLLAELGQIEQFLAVTKNGAIVKRDQWNEETIEPDDAIDILTIVGGG